MGNIFILKTISYICLSYVGKSVSRSALVKKVSKIKGLRADLITKKGTQKVRKGYAKE